MESLSQGSVLGQLLFLIYINGPNCVVTLSKIYDFGDDTNVFSNSLKDMHRKVNMI